MERKDLQLKNTSLPHKYKNKRKGGNKANQGKTYVRNKILKKCEPGTFLSWTIDLKFEEEKSSLFFYEPLSKWYI